MRIAQAACNFLAVGQTGWSADWVWGLPLIVLTVLIHISGLGIISQRVVHGNVARMIERRHPTFAFVVVLGATTLLATCLHGIEACIWAVVYSFLGAIHELRYAMLYSLNAITSYGHTNLELSNHWHLMGALEALNGWLLFGLTTAFLFAIIEKVLRLGGTKEHR